MTAYACYYYCYDVHAHCGSTFHIYRTNRNCLKTTDINGVTIPKGAVVHIPIHLFHHLPEYWPNPDKFDPER